MQPNTGLLQWAMFLLGVVCGILGHMMTAGRESRRQAYNAGYKNGWMDRAARALQEDVEGEGGE